MMMATAGPPSTTSLLPLLESLEDSAAGLSEQTDAYLTIANRLSGEEGRQFLPAVEKHFCRLGKAILAHITSPNAELSQAALQALGFCVYHSHVVSAVPEPLAAEILATLCALVVKSTDKNTCTRALWVISKQSFPADVVAKKVLSILGTLGGVWSREDIQSVVMEHEALNVIIRMLEQVPTQMGDGAVQWAKLVIPLVVHSASKVRLRAAAAMEMGLPLLLEKQMDVAAVIEPMMSTKLIPELQKLFMSKNETNVLKLWPLFVKLLGKLLHRGGPFINSLLHLEELGFRSPSPTIKKIAFIAWKSLIDNFALNPDILSSAKRMKLLMQPLMSIHVRTEALLLTKVEVWWYLVVQLGPNLSHNFDQVSVPLLQCTIGTDSSSVPGTPSRPVTQNGAVAPGTPKTAGNPAFNSSVSTPRMSLNSSVQVPSTFPSIQLLGLEMMLHYFLGPEVVAVATKNKLILSLEPLNHPLLSGTSSFTKHAAVLISNIRDGFTNVGKDAPESLLSVIWTSLVQFVNLTIESVGSKKDRQGCEVLTLTLQALQSIVTSEALPADRVLVLFEATVKGIPQRVLGSTSYQVGKMDVLNGTPALFLLLLLYNSSMLPAYMEDERFFLCLQTLVSCGLSGPTSPLAFAEAVLSAISRSAASLQNKEQLWRMWSVMVSPLTDTITQSNEVNQGDALEHNFSAMYSALMLPVTHLLHGTPLPQAAQKSMLSSWSKLYKVFARCSALVVTAEENVCCEELCAKMAAAIDREALKVPSTLNAMSSVLQVVVECVDFSPYTPQFQQKLKSPYTPVNWMRKRNKVLGNLSTFQSLLVQCLEVYLEAPDASSEAAGSALVSILSVLFTNLILANVVQEALTSLVEPLTLFYKQAASEPPSLTPQLLGKLEKLLCEVLGCLQTCSTLAYNDELLARLSPLLCVLFPHKNKQLRTPVSHFWNATFANTVSLTYPEEIRPVLSQVKQKTPIVLPGFGAVSVPDELSGQYSSESSQLETKLSGMAVSSVGKRDSLLGTELKDRSAARTSKPVSMKLDFGTPKPPHRELLEEEASIDFVFIPPETKERVLTEHQKEVKRTKRVDIPAMYNNLDASLDTTVFSQYTQSQEDSLDKLPPEQAGATTEAPGKAPESDVEREEDPDVPSEETQDYTSPKSAGESTENHQQEEEVIPDSADVSMEDDTKSGDRAEDVDMQQKDDTSPNMSTSSDLVSGTPQKPNSRRQSFITLEKYEGKPGSPSSVSSFTGPLVKTSNSQERSNKTSSFQGSRTSTGPNSQDSQSTQTRKMNSQSDVNEVSESPRRPKDSRTKSEPVKLTDRLPSDSTEDEDVIPDTQTEVEGKESPSTLEDIKSSSQEEDSESPLDDSQSSETQTSPGKPRRSRRSRVRPLLPGEDPDERDAKHSHSKRKQSGDEPNGDSPKSSRPNTRSKQAAEENRGRDGVRTRAQRDSSGPSQTNSQGRPRKKIKLYSHSEELLHKPERKRRSTSERESSQTDGQSDTESQLQRRRSRPGKASLEANKEEHGTKEKVSPDKEGSSQMVTQELQDQIVVQEDDEPKGSEVVTLSSQTGAKSQESQPVEKAEKHGRKLEKDSQIVVASPWREDSQIMASSPPQKDSVPAASSPPQKDSVPAASSPPQKDSVPAASSPPQKDSVPAASSPPQKDSVPVESSPPQKDSVPVESSPPQKDSVPVESSPPQKDSVPVESSPPQKDSVPVESSPPQKDSVPVESSPPQKDSVPVESSPPQKDSVPVASSPPQKDSVPVASSPPQKDSVPVESSPPQKDSVPVASSPPQKDSVLVASSPLQKVSLFLTSSTLKDSLVIVSSPPKKYSEITSSPQTEGLSRDSESVGTTENQSQMVTSSSTDAESREEKSVTNKLADEELIEDKPKTEEDIEDDLSQEDSQTITPLSSDSQPKRRSRRSKASETAKSQDKSESTGSSGRQSRSNSQAGGSALSQEVEVRAGGRTRRSKAQEELSKSSPSSTPESSQSLDMSASESSQGRGRYSRRRSSPAVAASTGAPESDPSEAKENPQKIPKKRGRKARASLQSPLTLESKVDADASQKADTESIDAETGTGLEESSQTQDLQVTGAADDQCQEQPPMEVEADALKETETADLEVLESVGISDEPSQEKVPCDPAVDTLAPPDVTTETLLVCSEEKIEEAETSDVVPEKRTVDSDSDEQEHPGVPEEDVVQEGHSQNQTECPDVTDELPKEEEDLPSYHHTEAGTEEEIAPLQENARDTKPPIMEPEDEDKTQTASADNSDAALTDVCSTSASSEPASNAVFQDSPVKQKDLEAVMGEDVGQSPSSGRTRGTWSPLASPSTSILKKGQKRPLEVETPSPLVKSRRVSFANPIQQQEMADDIDRRSPAIRTSSPRRSKGSSIPQPKHVTTPTKGFLILSPRNLHSPGYKSSKKCLISEMSQEPRPVSRDCIYPALVGCSTPVEAVLPQISSNMWSRGFGQLVRARNIKTVGDLSALTPSEIKTLPIRSPKISNVKKALKTYEQQRKGRGGDELKSFDEMEMMTSELEEASSPQNPDEEDKTSAETLATELVDELVPAEGRPQQQAASGNQTPDTPAGDRRLHPDRLPSEVEGLTCRMTPLELSRCSPQQLVEMHDQLGGMMRRVVVELQTRVCQTNGKR